MTIVTAVSLVVALAFITQGVYVLKTGSIGIFFVPHVRPPSPRRTIARIEYGAFYIACGLWVLFTLLHVPLGGTFSLRQFAAWTFANWDSLLIGLLVGAVGVLLIVRPAVAASWARAAYPEVRPDNKGVLLAIRIVAAVLAGLAILILASAFQRP